MRDFHCPHCGSLNAEGEARCRRCGRRLLTPVVRTGGGDLERGAGGGGEAGARPAVRARQAALFDDRPKIIPIETVTRPRAARPQPRRQERSPGARAAIRAAQQPLDLRGPAVARPKAVTYDAPVARPGVRLKAAAWDAVLVAVGVAVAAAAFRFLGGELIWSGKAVLPSLVTVLALVFAYGLFWSLLGCESAGMQFMKLRLLTFDGQTPTWGQYVGRFLLTWLSIAAAGIGLIWVLIDDESLTFHDHVSKTFPTLWHPRPATFHRH